MTSALTAGMATLARAMRSLTQAVQDHQSHIYSSHARDIESYPSTSPLDKYDTREMAPEARSAEMGPVVEALDDDLKGNTPDPSSPQRPPPQSWKTRRRRLWKKVQNTVSKDRKSVV